MESVPQNNQSPILTTRKENKDPSKKYKKRDLKLPSK